MISADACVCYLCAAVGGGDVCCVSCDVWLLFFYVVCIACHLFCCTKIAIIIMSHHIIVKVKNYICANIFVCRSCDHINTNNAQRIG